MIKSDGFCSQISSSEFDNLWILHLWVYYICYVMFFFFFLNSFYTCCKVRLCCYTSRGKIYPCSQTRISLYAVARVPSYLNPVFPIWIVRYQNSKRSVFLHLPILRAVNLKTSSFSKFIVLLDRLFHIKLYFWLLRRLIRIVYVNYYKFHFFYLY